MASPLFQRTSVQVFDVFRRRISNSWLTKTLESTLDLSDDRKSFSVSFTGFPLVDGSFNAIILILSNAPPENILNKSNKVP